MARVVAWFFIVHISDMSDHIVAVEEFFVANRTLVISLAGVGFHVPSEFRLGVESEATNLKKNRQHRKNPP